LRCLSGEDFKERTSAAVYNPIIRVPPEKGNQSCASL